jgi:hypothetical protein
MSMNANEYCEKQGVDETVGRTPREMGGKALSTTQLIYLTLKGVTARD